MLPQSAILKLRTYGFWKRQARTWHWMSGAISLIGMLLFAFTGITLNHAADIQATPSIVRIETQLPEDLLSGLATQPTEGTTEQLPAEIIRQLRRDPGVNVSGRVAEWTDIDVYIALARPGGDAWLAIDRETGALEYEQTSRGVIAYLNDLHKGRNTGAGWAIFLDVFSVATILFCLSGLWLLHIHAGRRRSTWPLAVSGLVLPVLILILFAH